MKYIYHFDYKLCNLSLRLGIAEKDKKICGIFFPEKKKPADFEQKETELIKKAANQIEEYINKKRKEFELPLIFHGTDFQIAVWKALQKIPYGKTCSYGEL